MSYIQYQRIWHILSENRYQLYSVCIEQYYTLDQAMAEPIPTMMRDVLQADITAIYLFSNASEITLKYLVEYTKMSQKIWYYLNTNVSIQ